MSSVCAELVPIVAIVMNEVCDLVTEAWYVKMACSGGMVCLDVGGLGGLCRFFYVGGMDGGRCQAVLVIVGVPGGKVIMGNCERFCFCVSIFLQRG